MDNQQGPTVLHRDFCSMLCGSLDGRGVRGRMGTCICMAEYLCCPLGITDSMDMSQWTPGVGDGQGGLACCNSWGCRVRHDWATELNWTETITALLISYTSIQNKKFFLKKVTTATTVYFMHFLYSCCVLPPHLMWTHPKFHDSVLCLPFSFFILPQRPSLLPLSGSLYEEVET